MLNALQQMRNLSLLMLGPLTMVTAADMVPMGNLHHLRFLKMNFLDHPAATGESKPQAGLLAALQRPACKAYTAATPAAG